MTACPFAVLLACTGINHLHTQVRGVLRMVAEANALVSCLCKGDTPLRFEPELQVSEPSRRVHALVLLSSPRVDSLPAGTILCTFSDCAFVRAIHRLRCLAVGLGNRADHGADRAAPMEMGPPHTHGNHGRVLRQWHRSCRAAPVSVNAVAVVRRVMLEATNVTRHLRTLLAPAHALDPNASINGIHFSKAKVPASTPNLAVSGQTTVSHPAEVISTTMTHDPISPADCETVKAGSLLVQCS